MHWLRWFRPRDFIVPLSAFGQRDLERRNMKGREPMYQESCEKCINMQSIQCVDMPKSTASKHFQQLQGHWSGHESWKRVPFAFVETSQGCKRSADANNSHICSSVAYMSALPCGPCAQKIFPRYGERNFG